MIFTPHDEYERAYITADITVSVKLAIDHLHDMLDRLLNSGGQTEDGTTARSGSVVTRPLSRVARPPELSGLEGSPVWAGDSGRGARRAPHVAPRPR